MSTRPGDRLFVLGSLLLAFVACSKGEAEPPPAANNLARAVAALAAAPAAPSQAAAPAAAPAVDPHPQAKALFQSLCRVCHGESGRGDGPGSASLNPKPRNYTDAVWQASVTDEQIKNTIMFGGAAVGKSPIMPASPDLQAKPEVVDELVKIVRSFRTL